MMVTVYYDWVNQTWVHFEKDLPSLSFGEREDILVGSRRKRTFLPFNVSVSEEKIIGPVVGIVVNRNEENSFSGNIKLFERLQRELFRVGGLSVVLTEDFFEKESGKHGFCYHPGLNKWIVVKVPTVQILYNRMYKECHARKVIEWCSEKDLPIFNRNYFDKLSTFLCLKENRQLSPYLPDTALLTERNFYDFTSMYQAVYIKKRKSSKGKGIFFLTLYGNAVILKTIVNTIMFPSLRKAFDYLQSSVNLEEYIIQQAAETVKMDGRKFDLRVLAHFVNGKHIVTGIGVRIAESQQVTTHVPNGGIIGDLKQLPIKIDEAKLRQVIAHVGTELATFEGTFIGEFSADIGVKIDGSFSLFEINAKPMDFDEEHIKRAGTENLINVFYENAKFFKKESWPTKSKHIITTQHS
ncbi:MAG: YheC/YheD family protein [Bacillaceae bacterium]|nr:YheC/YheD family protein [Bacillaceae bacterium]